MTKVKVSFFARNKQESQRRKKLDAPKFQSRGIKSNGMV